MLKKVYIFLTTEEKKKATTICQKYHVSLSTLTDKIAFEFYHAFLHYHLPEKIIESITEVYIVENVEEHKLNQKTSIKPKIASETQLVNNWSKYCTNVLKIYLNKRLSRWINEKGCEMFYNRVDKKLQECKEQFWNYNNFVRSSRRNLRENKDYYKRAINDMENK